MKVFRDPVAAKGQMFLLPASVDDFVPSDAPVRVLGEIIDSMELPELYAKYRGGGAPAYEPKTMLKVLIFAYCQGLQSSRKIDAALGQDLRFMFLSEMSRPDFRTIATFRSNNLEILEKTFKETVRLSMEMGLVFLEHVSVDGTKIEANVSGKETYKRERLDKAREAIDKRIGELIKESEELDREEDKTYGDKRGDEIAEDLKDAKRRKKRLEDAKKAMDEAGRDSIGATDTDSRLMKTKSGNRPAYNGQAVVDKEHQVIVAADVTQDESDNKQLAGMIELTKGNTGAVPATVTVDGGYYSPESLKYVDTEQINALIPDTQPKESGKDDFIFDEEKDEYTCPLGKALTLQREREMGGKNYKIYRCYTCSGCPDGEKCHGNSSRYKELWRRQHDELQQAMAEKVRSEAGKALYRLRKQIVEPVFGNIKANMGIRRLVLCGLAGAKTEYLLGCIGHNIGKISRYWRQEGLGAAA